MKLVAISVVKNDADIIEGYVRHPTWIESAADPRKLALIFLSLRID